ncbi:hypothetical protein [Sutcliffiella rhizosphaerae]|uniref:ABC transporter permease n=1 Tax=Sutcliffiella rhizosphaerae TaxID=2880967 RepID=A0ABN8ACY1_9BACI|nr:hypothetical protein [Sutcliffiella rhizosphaerae]CAG9623098.1 hypothetical protein BACCIP111883_03894 [Sutcliffiella rhizosphaerae]
MKILIWQHLNLLMTKALILFIAIFTLTAVGDRKTYDGSFSLFVLYLITDHYVIIFLMTPFFLLCLSKLYNEPRMVELIRTEKFYRFMFTKWLAITLFSFIFAGIIVLVSMMVSIGLPLNNNWQSSLDAEMMQYFMSTFSNPVQGVLYSVLYLFVGYSFIGCTFVTMVHFFSRKATYFCIGLLYIVMILSIKVPWMGNIPFIGINRYIVLHHNFTGNYSIWWTIFAMVLLSLFQIYSILRFWFWSPGNAKKLKKGLFTYYTRILWTPKLVSIWCTSITILAVTKAAFIEETLNDYFMRFFYGLPIGSMHVLTWLEQMIYIGTPMYTFGIFVQAWCYPRYVSLFMRIQKKSAWGRVVLGHTLLLAVVYVILSVSILLIIGILFDKTLVIDWYLLSYIVLIKILELSCMMTLLLVLFIVTNRVTLSFLTTMSLYLINVLPINWLSYNVAGSGQLARMEEMGRTMLEMAIVSFIVLCCMVITIRWKSYKYFERG